MLALSHGFVRPFVGLVFDLCPFWRMPFLVALNLDREDHIKSESKAKH